MSRLKMLNKKYCWDLLDGELNISEVFCPTEERGD